MDINVLVKIMENELKCVLRAREHNCNQGKCACCDLVMPDNLLVNAYENVIEILKGMDDDLK